jgi:uncharacterized delta-60 repeat protein
MTLAARLRTARTGRFKSSRGPGRLASSRPTARELRIERLEVRLAFSGFGLEDGAYIVEDRPLSRYWDVQIQPHDQAIVAVAVEGTPDLAFRRAAPATVARYDSQGSVDSAYGVSGLATLPAGMHYPYYGKSLAIQPDGKAVVAGRAQPGNLAVARLDLDGSLDASFGNGGSVTAGIPFAVGGIGLQSSGKVVVAGVNISRSPYRTGPAFAARFTATGALDSGSGGFGQFVGGGEERAGYTVTSFGSGGEYYYHDLAVQTDDKIVAIGYFRDSNGARLLVARYTADGVLDNTFNTVGYILLPRGTGSSIALQSDGKIVVAGSTAADTLGDMFVARVNVNGTLDTTFGGGDGYAILDIDGTASQTVERASDVAIQPDGKIVVVGEVGDFEPDVSAPVRVLVARINVDGSSDLSFGGTGFKQGGIGTAEYLFKGHAVALQSDGTIIVAGAETFYNVQTSRTRPLLMRFYGDVPTSGPVIRGGDGDDTFHVLRSADELLVYHNIAPTGEPTHRISLSGLNIVTVDGRAGNDSLTVDSGAAGSLGIARLVYNAGSGVNALTLERGAARIDSTAASGSLNTTVATGAHLSTSHLQQNALTLAGATTRVTILPGPGAPGQASVLTSLNIATGATLDITDNALVIDYTDASPAATIREKILAGRGGAGFGASWTGAGINSSAAAAANAQEPESRSVAYAENGALPLGPYTTFRGQPVDNTSVLIVYTRTGDANLDGLVNDDDATILGAAYAPGVPQPSWSLADFDYNGFVDDDDATLLGAFYQRSNPAAAPANANVQNDLNLASTNASPELREASLFNRHARAALRSEALDQLLFAPESTWTARWRVKMRV